MCGIYAAISTKKIQSCSSVLRRALDNRGPDYHGQATVELEHSEKPVFVALESTVLYLRGDELTQQPLTSESCGSLLCWNGEAWKIDEHPIKGNDGRAVLELLASAGRNTEDDFLNAFRRIDGPFAFVFFNKSTNRLYFGRDRLGRRSLLVKVEEDSIQISSISDEDATEWMEVEADGIYRLDLEPDSFEPNQAPTRFDWTNDDTLVRIIETE